MKSAKLLDRMVGNDETVQHHTTTHSWLITVFVIRVTWRVSLVEQELINLTEHQSSLPVFYAVFCK